MNTAITGLLARTPAAQPDAGQPPATAKDDFWREFLRVETDRFLLVLLIVALHFWHASDTLMGTAIGGLIMSIQQQRFRWTKP